MSVRPLSVVVPTHQRRALVLRALEALAAQRPVGIASAFDVTVVSDGSTDGTAAAIRGAAPRWPMPVAVVDQANSGAATARNAGVAASEGRHLLFVDDDMIAHAGAIEAHLRDLAEHPDGVTAGAIRIDPSSPRSYLTEGLRRWADRREERLAAATSLPFHEVLTGHLRVSRAGFERLGRFDVRFTAGGTFGGEDLEFGWRAAEAGEPMRFLRDAIVYQVFDKSFASLARDVREGGAADAAFARKHPGVVSHLTLGSVGSLPPWERRALRLTLGAPAVARVLFALPILSLRLAARAGWRGTRLEHLHAVARAHLYGLGLGDAGWSTR